MSELQNHSTKASPEFRAAVDGFVSGTGRSVLKMTVIGSLIGAGLGLGILALSGTITLAGLIPFALGGAGIGFVGSGAIALLVGGLTLGLIKGSEKCSANKGVSLSQSQSPQKDFSHSVTSRDKSWEARVSKETSQPEAVQSR
jgi:hypothetical protein